MKTALISILAALILVGAGCDTSKTTVPQTKSAGERPDSSSTLPPTIPVGDTSDDLDPYALTLSAEAIGNQTVRVAFHLPDEMLIDAKAFRLLLSKNEEPTRENASNWYDLGIAHQKKDWRVNTTGERYVRVCVVYDDKCETYSNIVKVNVQ